MIILGIMQNQWFHNAEGWRKRFETLKGAKRRRMIARCLFATRNHSGRRIRAAFGDLIELIEWEESSKEIGDHSSFKPKADVDHVRAVIEEVEPDLIICFGRVAQGAVSKLVDEPGKPWTVIYTPHPAARGSGVTEKLEAAADILRRQLETDGEEDPKEETTD